MANDVENLFDIALQKTNLSASEVWYCGDNPQADIEGSSQVGIYPICMGDANECSFFWLDLKPYEGDYAINTDNWNCKEMFYGY